MFKLRELVTFTGAGTTLPRGKVRGECIDALIFFASILPLLYSSYLPLQDLPDHVARLSVLRGWAASPYLQEYYYYRWQLIPSLALDLFAVPLLPFLSDESIVRLFCVVSFALIFFGTRLVNRQLGGPSACAYRAGPLFLYAGPFQFGFLNYWCGVGCGLVAFGYYLANRQRPLLWRIAVFTPIAVVVLLCHLEAFGIYAIAVGAFELGEALWPSHHGMTTSLRKLVVHELGAACHLCPPLLILAWGSPLAHGGLQWSTLQQRLEAIAALTVFAAPYLELLLLAITTVLLLVAVRSKVARIHRNLWPLLAAMTIVFLAAPRDGAGGGYIDYRLPAAAVFYMIGYIVPGERASERVPAVSLGLTLLLGLRFAIIAGQWLAWEPGLAQLDAALSSLPRGARIMVVEGALPSTSERRRPPLGHVAGYAVARREAFVPSLLASIPGFIFYYQAEFQRYHERIGLDLPSTVQEIDPIYQYLLVLRPRYAEIAPGLALSLLSQGEYFDLYTANGAR